MIGIPYARQEWCKIIRGMVAICPKCHVKIVLSNPKDKDSMSTSNYAKHWEIAHK